MVSYDSEDTGLKLGLYFPDTVPGAGNYAEFERLIGAKIDLISFYWSWGLGKSETPFHWIQAILADQKLPLVTWEPWVIPADYRNPAGSIEDANFRLRRIIEGRFDDYVCFWAKGLKAIKGQILLRPMHEMNGKWYPWCGTINDNKPQDFVLAWKHLYRFFAHERLHHVKWVWSPYALSVPGTAANEIERYYPGDDYVDWIGLDGYNWGDTRDWSSWQTFETVFERAYRVVARMSAKPIMIAEMGCAESGGSKPRWIRDALVSVREAYPRLGAVTWFNANKECDWRIESSEASLSSFREHWMKKRGGCDAL